MATKQEINKNDDNKDMSCTRCTKLLNILKHKPEGDIQLKCDDCGKDDPVVALCVDCELYLCHDCNKYHSKKYETHDIILLDRTSEPCFCPEHPNYKIEHYCKTCSKISCLFCAMNQHVGDDDIIIAKMTYKRRKIDPVEEMSENLSKAEANVVSTQEKIKEQTNEIDQ